MTSPAPATPHTRNAEYEDMRVAMLGTFTAGLGHELRNLVMPLMLRIDVLTTRAELSAAALDDVDRIRRSVRRLHALADTLLLLDADPFAHADGAVEVRASDYADQLRTIAHSVLHGKVAVHLDIPDDIAAVRIPSAVLAQATLCALTRIRTISNGQVQSRLTISARESQDRVIVEFSLSGDGHASVSSESAMELTSEMLQRFGGTMQCAYREDQSSVFTLALPTARSPLPSQARRVRVHISDPRRRVAVRHIISESHCREVDADEVLPADLIICDVQQVDALWLDARDDGDDASPQIIVIGARPDGYAKHRVEFVELTDVAQLMDALNRR